MSVKLKITVTKEILEKSKNCGQGGVGVPTSQSCAIALAIRDVFPYATIGATDMIFGVTITDFTPLPKAAKQFIVQFDSLCPKGRVNMTPITFELTIPDDVIAAINIDEVKPLLVNHPTLELIEQ